jgi:hypothetical protein
MSGSGTMLANFILNLFPESEAVILWDCQVCSNCISRLSGLVQFIRILRMSWQFGGFCMAIVPYSLKLISPSYQL